MPTFSTQSSSDVDSPTYLTLGGVPDQDSAVLAGRSERVAPWVDCQGKQTAFMDLFALPGGLAGLAVECVHAALGISDYQSLSVQAPAPGYCVIPNRRRPAPEKHTPRVVAIYVRHAANPCLILSSSRLRPMKTS